MNFKLSIVIPCYNEKDTIEKIIRAVRAAPVEGIGGGMEIIVVDDFSTDGTRDVLAGKIAPTVDKIFYHDRNRGKGAALRTGIAAAVGDMIILQDADLEYTPEDYPELIRPILEGRTELVLGSRFRTSSPKFFTKNGDVFFSHYVGNRIIIALTNFLYGQTVTDYEGCYKAFTKALAQKVDVKANGFEFDNELVCKTLRLGYEVVEVPIRYHPRLYSQGKKIRWTDGMRMLWTILKWRFWPISGSKFL